MENCIFSENSAFLPCFIIAVIKKRNYSEDKISHGITSYLKEALRYSCLEKVDNEFMNLRYQIISKLI